MVWINGREFLFFHGLVLCGACLPSVSFGSVSRCAGLLACISARGGLAEGVSALSVICASVVSLCLKK